jgi:hypothetical protein
MGDTHLQPLYLMGNSQLQRRCTQLSFYPLAHRHHPPTALLAQTSVRGHILRAGSHSLGQYRDSGAG